MLPLGFEAWVRRSLSRTIERVVEILRTVLENALELSIFQIVPGKSRSDEGITLLSKAGRDRDGPALQSARRAPAAARADCRAFERRRRRRERRDADACPLSLSLSLALSRCRVCRFWVQKTCVHRPPSWPRCFWSTASCTSCTWRSTRS